VSTEILASTTMQPCPGGNTIPSRPQDARRHVRRLARTAHPPALPISRITVLLNSAFHHLPIARLTDRLAHLTDRGCHTHSRIHHPSERVGGSSCKGAWRQRFPVRRRSLSLLKNARPNPARAMHSSSLPDRIEVSTRALVVPDIVAPGAGVLERLPSACPGAERTTQQAAPRKTSAPRRKIVVVSFCQARGSRPTASNSSITITSTHIG